MKKQTVAGLFFSMFLRASVVILGICIVVFGIVLITKAFKGGDNKKGTPTTVSSNILTEAEVHDELIYNTTESTEVEDTSTETESEPVYTTTSTDKNILVLNSTDVSGLAGRWCTTLNENGYNNTFASDYFTNVETTKIISKQEGVGEDLLQFFEGATYEVGDLDGGSSEPSDNYDIIIIVGNSHSDH